MAQGLLIALGCGTLVFVIGGGGLACRSKPDPAPTEGAAPASAAPASDVSPAPLAAQGEASNPACAKAEACCRAMVKKLPTAQQNFSACGEVHKMPASNCIPMFEKYRQAAQAMGATCD